MRTAASLAFLPAYFKLMKRQMNCASVLLCLLGTAMMFSTGHAQERGHMIGMTEAHNAVRSQVGINGLAWSDELAGHAQQWADYLATENNCSMKHRPRTGKFAGIYGENLYWASPLHRDSGKNERQEIQPAAVVATWKKEKTGYDYRNNTCMAGKSCGHYTQILWKNSTRLGCGMAFCPDNSQIWVCNYDPPGNFKGERPY